MRRLAVSLTLCGTVLCVLAVAVRYLMAVWPAPDVDLLRVDSRLMFLQYGSVFLALAAGSILAWTSSDRWARWRIGTLLVSVGAVLVFSWVRYPAAIEPQPEPSSPGPYRFKADWVSRNADLWTAVLGHLKDKREVHALEIGSFEGRSAIWFLDHVLTHPTSSITCIDVWSDVGDPLFGEQDEKTFDDNIAAHGQGQKVRKLKGFSEDRLPGLKKEFYDFVYIDGSHLSRDALLDAAFSWRLLKPGGYMIFDDYVRREFRLKLIPHLTARMGIDAFLKVFAPYIDVIHRDFQVVVRKKQTGVDLVSYKPLHDLVVTVQQRLH